jgi:hypothetical protein
MKRIGVRKLAALLATLDRAKFVNDNVLVDEAQGYPVDLDVDRRLRQWDTPFQWRTWTPFKEAINADNELPRARTE